jgi:hypothetical protein
MLALCIFFSGIRIVHEFKINKRIGPHCCYPSRLIIFSINGNFFIGKRNNIAFGSFSSTLDFGDEVHEKKVKSNPQEQ